MALRIRVTSPVYCGKCGKRRGFAHVCIVRRPNGRTRLKTPGVMLASCPNCGKPYANPLTHVCASKRGDFGRRKAEHEKARIWSLTLTAT
jgi:predicted metal-binding protein